MLIAGGSWSEDSEIHLKLGLRPFPANDQPEQARVLAGESVLVEGSLAGAGPEGTLSHGGTTGLDTVWYRWTAPSSGQYLISLLPVGSAGSGLQRVGLDAYRRTGATLSAPLTGSGVRGVQFEAAGGEVFDFAVFQRWAAGEDFRIRIRRVVSPSNDAFAAAAVLTGDSPVFAGTLEGSTLEVGGPDGTGSWSGGSVWFRWVAPRDGVAHAQVNGGAGQVGLMALKGSSLPNLLRQASVSDGIWPSIRFRAAMGETYYLRVGQDDYSGGEYKLELQLRDGPANDEFAERAPVLIVHGFLDGDLRDATYQADELGAEGPSVWWGWTAPASGDLSIRVDRADFRSSLLVLSVPDMTILGTSQGNPPALGLDVEAGKQYAIRVSGVGSESGRFVLRFDQVTQPTNDHFRSRQILTGREIHLEWDNFLATFEPGEPSIRLPNSRKSVWWSWTAPVTGVATIDTVGSDFDTLLGVFQGETLAGLSLVADDDEGGGRHTSRLELKATAGVTYQIVVDGWNVESGLIALNLRLVEEPRILAFPQAQRFVTGAPLTLTVDAWGVPPLTYHWFKDGVAIPGATGPGYAIAVASADDSGSYSVTVGNPKGAARSRAAAVVVGRAIRVGVFADPAFVDADGGPESESESLQASLQSLGPGVLVSASPDLDGLAGTSEVIVIPEQERGELGAALGLASRNRLKGFVETGGVLIVNGSFNGWAATLLNAVFGFDLEDSPAGEGAPALQLGSLPAGSPFESGPILLPLNDGSTHLRTSSLPPGSQPIYRRDAVTGVAVIPVGQGHVVYLGWDWWNSAPLGNQDGGWLDILNRALQLRR